MGISDVIGKACEVVMVGEVVLEFLPMQPIEEHVVLSLGNFT